MSLTIDQEFKLALHQHNAEQDSFKPLLEKLEELKQVVESNFMRVDVTRKWYGKVVRTKRPGLTTKIESKFIFQNVRYIQFNMGIYRYVVGIGEIGDLKDRLYFIPGKSFINDSNKTSVLDAPNIFGVTRFYLEDKITCVQMFSKLIHDYKEWLVTGD